MWFKCMNVIKTKICTLTNLCYRTEPFVSLRTSFFSMVYSGITDWETNMTLTKTSGIRDIIQERYNTENYSIPTELRPVCCVWGLERGRYWTVECQILPRLANVTVQIYYRAHRLESVEKIENLSSAYISFLHLKQ